MNLSGFFDNSIFRTGLIVSLIGSLQLLPSVGHMTAYAAPLSADTHRLIPIDLRKPLAIPPCASINSDGHLHVDSGACGDAIIEYDVSHLLPEQDIDVLWYVSVVTSSRRRTGVHLYNGKDESYSYHSGDGTEQELFGESTVPTTGAVIRVRVHASEVGDSKGPVIVKRIAVIPRSAKNPLLPQPSKNPRWHRTNNPNPESWVDRWSSPYQNYAVHVPHSDNLIWERFFALGVDDRFSKGDYFCFPDDTLVGGSEGESPDASAIYMGALPWVRRVEENGADLRITFSYEGPYRQHERAKLIPPLGDVRDNISDARMANLHLRLEKAYSFNVKEPFGRVNLRGTISGIPNLRSSWVVYDSAYLDFAVGSSRGVAIFNGRSKNVENVVTPHQIPLPVAHMLYRLNEGIRLAAAYSFGTSDFAFSLKRSSLFLRPQLFLPGLKDSGAQLLKPGPEERAPWFHGLGFYFDKGELNGDFRMLFTSDYSSVTKAWSTILRHARAPSDSNHPSPGA